MRSHSIWNLGERAALYLLLVLNLMTIRTVYPAGADWGVNPYQIATLTEPGEAAARQIGFASPDGRGRALILDTFSGGLGSWVTNTSGSGATPVLKTNFPTFIAPVALYLDPGSVLNDFSSIVRYLFLGQTSRVGFEVTMFSSDPRGGHLRLQQIYNYNGVVYQAYLEYFPLTGEWKVLTPTGVQTVITQPASDDWIWTPVKMVVDFSKAQYARIIIGESSFDASAFSIQTIVSGILEDTSAFTISDISSGEAGAPTYSMRIGYVLLTRDEP